LKDKINSGRYVSRRIYGGPRVDSSVDSCIQWYATKRNGFAIFWIVGSLLLGGVAFYLNWKYGAAWIVFAVLGFVVIEKSLMRRVDPAAPR
jgi:hypothetical protein